jgi:hypothetical protein|tara:strand:+ start:99 stop:401 length:303 start_codon:yes stop_codon:yes gene_type:complete
MVTKEEEEKFMQENLKEAIKDSKKPEPSGRIHGIIGIIAGITGFFMYWVIGMFFGMLALVLGTYAIRHGQRKIGVISSILGLLNLALSLFLYLRASSLIS